MEAQHDPQQQMLKRLAELIGAGQEVGEPLLIRALSSDESPESLTALKRWTPVLSSVRKSPGEPVRAAAVDLLTRQGFSAEEALEAVSIVIRSVLAQVGEGTYTVAPDGSGHFTRLQDAVSEVPDGSTLRLAPGTHHIKHQLTLSKPRTLIGAGAGQTVIYVKEGLPFQCSLDGLIRASGLTIRCEEGESVQVFKGRLEMIGCHIEGGKGAQIGPFRAQGVGLRVKGEAFVQDCEFRGYEHAGAVVDGEGQLTLERCLFEGASDGSLAAVHVKEKGEATVRDCQINHDHRPAGIHVAGNGRALLEGNRSVRTILIEGRATAECRRNTLSNFLHGIRVRENARAVLEENTIEQCAWSILFHDQASGAARRNICRDTTNGGIQVNTTGTVDLEENRCERFADVGINVGKSARGTLRGNHCTDGRGDGIRVGDK
ncbi:MAG: right-handed parallel beta-helix repeat-containing protein, partial [Bacillota bacterium]